MTAPPNTGSPRLGEGPTRAQSSTAQQSLFSARPVAQGTPQSPARPAAAAPQPNVAPQSAQTPNRASQTAAARPPIAAPQQLAPRPAAAPPVRPAGATPGQPQLRPYQREADAAIEHELEVKRLRSTMYVAATGTGKTLVIASRVRRVKTRGGRTLVLAHRDELLGQIEKKLADIGLSADREQGKHRASTTARVVVASVQTLRAARLKRWPHDHFAEIIVDECFPAGTIVDGRPIESLRVGDRVRSYNHVTGQLEERPITQLFASRPTLLVTVHLDDGRAITCTAGHPFYALGGYAPAILLRPGDWLFSAADSATIAAWEAWSQRGHGDPWPGFAKLPRVAGVELHERGASGFGVHCPGDLVYNLEVDGNHNYFVDEILVHNCHHSTAAGYVAIFDHFPDAKILGVTATPIRADGKALGEIFESVAYRYEILRGIREKYLVPIVARQIEIDSVDLTDVAVAHGDFTTTALAAVMEDERALMGTVIPLLELARDRSTVVFSVDIDHAQMLADRINARRPGAARAVSGKTDEDERREFLAAFDRGEFQFLCNCALLTEGWDSARVSCVAMARPTKSWALAVQCIGRGLRLHGTTYEESVRNGKHNALVLNFSGRTKHRLIGPADCLAGSEQGASAIADDVAAEVNRLLGTQQLELEKVVAMAEEAVGKRRASLAQHALVRYHAEHIDPFVGPDPGGDGQVELGWANRPPTDAQRAALDKQGVTLSKLPPSFSMADASRLLARIAARPRVGLCTLRQAKAIAQGTGIDTRAITFARGAELCTMLRENGWQPHALRHTPEWRAAHPREDDEPLPPAETARVLRSLAEDRDEPAPASTSAAGPRTFHDELVGGDQDGAP